MKWLFALCIALAPVVASAQVTISSLPAAAPMSGTEVLPVIQSGSTKRTTAADIVQIVTKGAKFSPNGGIGSATSTVTSGEPTGGTFSINGQTGIGAFSGSALYPRILGSAAGGAAKYDASGVLLANSIGAKTGLFGLAAKDGVQWPNTYISGVDATGHAQVYSISTTGDYGGVFASRSSDNPGANQNVIGSISLCVADNTTQSDVCWGGYDATYIIAGSNSRGAFGREISVVNGGATPALGDPYNFNVNGFSNALRLDCGDGIAVSNGCSSALTIIPNNGQARSGIVFGDGALVKTAGYATAVAMPSGYGFDWYTATATPVWRILSNASGSTLSQMILGDGALDIYLTNGSSHPFSVSSSGISATGYKVGSTAGVSCAAGAVTLASLVVTNGIITHC